MSLSQTMVIEHFTTVFLIILCGIKLHALKRTRDVELRYLWLTWISTLLLCIQDILETVAASDPSLRFWRTLFSVAGYILRPVAAVGLLLVVISPEKRTWKLWIPALINAVVNMTALFSPVAFSFDQNYDFVRGPLGWVVFAVSFVYLGLILWVVLTRFYEGRRSERVLLICCVLGVIAAAAVDAILAGRHLNEAIMIGCIFIMFYLRAHDNYMDPLTNLRNRFAYYDDSKNLSRNISAVASMDMNGLKQLNDTQGHAAGDAALAEIGRCLNEISDRQTIAYRVGGDEFVILFLERTQEEVERVLNELSEKIAATGYSVSSGYVMKAPDQDLEKALRESDRNMYQAKAEYYQKNGRDRRSRRT